MHVELCDSSLFRNLPASHVQITRIPLINVNISGLQSNMSCVCERLFHEEC